MYRKGKTAVALVVFLLSPAVMASDEGKRSHGAQREQGVSAAGNAQLEAQRRRQQESMRRELDAHRQRDARRQRDLQGSIRQRRDEIINGERSGLEP